MNIELYECQVWDSVTGEWSRITVAASGASPDMDYEKLAVIGQEINRAVSTKIGEEEDAWIMMDTHALMASGETVVMIQLRAKDSDDISVIMAVQVPAEETGVIHAAPAINEGCNHRWEGGADGNPERCIMCGLSFTRYVHSCY